MNENRCRGIVFGITRKEIRKLRKERGIPIPKTEEQLSEIQNWELMNRIQETNSGTNVMELN